jgi:hypothetical protein
LIGCTRAKNLSSKPVQFQFVFHSSWTLDGGGRLLNGVNTPAGCGKPVIIQTNESGQISVLVKRIAM